MGLWLHYGCGYFQSRWLLQMILFSNLFEFEQNLSTLYRIEIISLKFEPFKNSIDRY